MEHALTIDYVPTAELSLYHRNPRLGDIRRIAESLDVNGQYKPVVVNRGTHTGRPSEVLAGNQTLLAARDLNWATLAVTWVDVDDERAARIVAADNRTSDLGGYDDRLLAELLGDLPNLDGTGYEPGDLDDLIAALQEQSPAPQLTPLAEDDGSSPHALDSGGGADVDGNTRRTRGLNDLVSDYAGANTRVLVLSYAGARYVWAVRKLGELADARGLETNSDTVIALLEGATGEEAPTEDAETVGADA